MNEKEFKNRDKIPEREDKYMCSHESCGQKPTHYVKKDEYYLVLCDEHYAECLRKEAPPEIVLKYFGIDTEDDGIPIVYGTQRKDYPQGLEFFCIFCGKVHKHGGAGHKVDHCTNHSSPFKKTGYYLRQKLETKK